MTVLQLRDEGQWSSTAAMGNYLHDDDQGKQDAQEKRISSAPSRHRKREQLSE
jgi:hypothetical protein